MTHMDQILFVPSHIDRRGRSAQQLHEEEATTEEGFVTSVRGKTAFCRFYRPGGLGLRTVANSEACNSADLMPLTRAGRGDFFVLSKALASLDKLVGDPEDEVDRQDSHYGLHHMDDHTLEIITETVFESLGFARSRYLAHTESVEADLAAAGKRAVELENGPLAKELAAEKADEEAVCPECHGTKKACPLCKGRTDPFDFGIPTTQVTRGRNAS